VFCSNEKHVCQDDLAQCRCCVSLVTRCAFDVHPAVGTTRRPTKHGFSGIPVRFLSLMWERRASLQKTLSLVRTLLLYMLLENYDETECSNVTKRPTFLVSWDH